MATVKVKSRPSTVKDRPDREMKENTILQQLRTVGEDVRFMSKEMYCYKVK